MQNNIDNIDNIDTSEFDKKMALANLTYQRLTKKVRQPVKYTQAKIGRNEKCPCGSGLKFKKCHGK